MSSSKLAELLGSLTKEESRRFYDFLKSPYFNKSKQVLKLYSAVKSADEINKISLYRKLYPAEKYNDQKIRSLTSDLYRALKRFIYVNESCNNQTGEQLVLQNFTRRRGAFDNFKIISKALQSALTNPGMLNQNYYTNLIEYEDNISMFHSEKLFLTNRSNIRQIIEYSAKNSIYYKLHYYNCLIQTYVPIDYHTDFLKKENINELKNLLNYTEEKLESLKKQDKLIFAEYLVSKIFMENSARHADILQEFLKKNYSVFNDVYLLYLYNVFSNYYINKRYYANDGKIDYYQQVINKFYYSIGLFDRIPVLPISTVNNIVQTSIEIDDIVFAEKFYETYRNKMEPEYKEDAILLIGSIILMHKNDLFKAAENLSKVSFMNYQMYLNAKTFLAYIYYELEDLESLEYLIDAVMHFLRRNKTKAEERFFVYYNFFHCLSVLIKPISAKRLAEIKTMIKKTENIAYKNWLIRITDKITPVKV